jgi:hypothetical protein
MCRRSAARVCFSFQRGLTPPPNFIPPLRGWIRTNGARSDFKKLERGKNYERVKANSNVVVLDPEVAAVFPNSDAVNKALHSLMEVGSRVSRLASAPNRPARLRRSHG